MDQYLSSVWLFAFNFAPSGWQMCNGQILAIQSNQALFALLGTNFGGNGTTNFGLPNLQGRIAIGSGQGPGLSNYQLGQLGGTENLTLLVSNLPLHTHAPSGGGVISAATAKVTGASATPTNNYFNTSSSLNGYNTVAGTNQTMLATNTASAVAGTSTPVALKNPYLALNYCIATTGLFPSRN